MQSRQTLRYWRTSESYSTHEPNTHTYIYSIQHLVTRIHAHLLAEVTRKRNPCMKGLISRDVHVYANMHLKLNASISTFVERKMCRRTG